VSGFTQLLLSPHRRQQRKQRRPCAAWGALAAKSSALRLRQRNSPLPSEGDSGAVCQAASAPRSPQDAKAEAIKHTSIYWLPVILFVAPGLNALMKYQIFL